MQGCSGPGGGRHHGGQRRAPQGPAPRVSAGAGAGTRLCCSFRGKMQALKLHWTLTPATFCLVLVWSPGDLGRSPSRPPSRVCTPETGLGSLAREPGSLLWLLAGLLAGREAVRAPRRRLLSGPFFPHRPQPGAPQLPASVRCLSQAGRACWKEGL